jgi:molybdopterin-guanine dinucleotide biosynthesis protein A
MFDAIVVAGGRGSRLGGCELGDKAMVQLAGRPLVDHVLTGVAGAGQVVCVGVNLPSQLPGEPLRCVEQPVGGGPLAAVAAGLVRVTADVVVLVGADTPFIGDALDALHVALTAGTADAAVLTDGEGRRHYLAAMWRTESLRSALTTLGEVSGQSMRSLYDLPQLVVLSIADTSDASFDVDTPDDLAVAELRISGPTRDSRW